MTLLSPSSFIRPRTLHQRGFVAKPRGFLWLSHLSCISFGSNLSAVRATNSRGSNHPQREKLSAVGETISYGSNHQQCEQWEQLTAVGAIISSHPSTVSSGSNNQQWEQPSAGRATINRGSNRPKREQPSAKGATVSCSSNHQQWRVTISSSRNHQKREQPSAKGATISSMSDNHQRKQQSAVVLRDKLIEFLFLLSFGNVVIPYFAHQGSKSVCALG